jgi:HPt (histidine-containing phosphotransfer) domain-containing protein
MGFDTSKKLAQSLKRVGLQAVEKGIHGWYYPLCNANSLQIGTTYPCARHIPPIMNAEFAHLDLSQASQYAVDAALLPSLMETFASSLTKERGAIDALLTNADAAAVRMSLHSLKGFVPIFCAAPLAQEVIQLEALSRQESLDNLRPRLKQLVAQLTALENDVQLWRERFARDPHDPKLFPSV